MRHFKWFSNSVYNKDIITENIFSVFVIFKCYQKSHWELKKFCRKKNRQSRHFDKCQNHQNLDTPFKACYIYVHEIHNHTHLENWLQKRRKKVQTFFLHTHELALRTAVLPLLLLGLLHICNTILHAYLILVFRYNQTTKLWLFL